MLECDRDAREKGARYQEEFSVVRNELYSDDCHDTLAPFYYYYLFFKFLFFFENTQKRGLDLSVKLLCFYLLKPPLVEKWETHNFFYIYVCVASLISSGL